VRSTAVAERYARTLRTYLSVHGGTAHLMEGARALAAALQQEKVRSLLRDPRISAVQKGQALQATLANRLPQPMLQFIALVSAKRRLEQLPQILEVFVTLAEQDAHIAHASVWSAAPLLAQQIDRLRERLQQERGGTWILHNRIDPQLIGGIRLQLGDRVVDATIHHKLEILKSRMLA